MRRRLDLAASLVGRPQVLYLDELKAQTGGRVLIVAPADPARTAGVAALLADLTREEAVIDDEAETVTAADATLLPRIVRVLDNRGIEIAEFTMRKASLDEVFLTLTGRLPEPDEVNPNRKQENRR